MRLIVIWAFVFFVASALATLMLYDNGRVSMVWGDWVLETSLSFMLAAILAFLAIGYGMVRLVMLVWHLPQIVAKRRQMKRYSAAQSSMHQGLLALEYGDWQKAEKLLIKSAKHSESGLVHYLSAAKMAHNQGVSERRDYYLKQAREAYPEEYVIIGLVEARLLKASQPDDALIVLQALFEDSPKEPAVVKDFALALLDAGHWERLERLMPDILKTKALVREELWDLEHKLLAGNLTACQTLEALNQSWNTFSRKHKEEPEILAEYVEQRIGFGDETGLKELIEKAVGRLWNDRLVHQYGRLTYGPAFERLKVAEKWQQGREQNPVLLLTLGRLACQSQMWAMAHNYFKTSLHLFPQIETFHALAKCYEAEGKSSQAALIYKEAILQLEQTTKVKSLN